jgi:hypothetical protein
MMFTMIYFNKKYILLPSTDTEKNYITVTPHNLQLLEQHATYFQACYELKTSV